VLLSGPVVVSITLILDGPDADVVLRLCDVYPDGRYMLMMEGHVRVAAALGNYTRAVPAAAGTLYNVSVDMGHISLAVNSAHRLSLLVTASNSPKLLVNQNDGADPLSDHHTPRSVVVSISDESYITFHVQSETTVPPS
jgi:predicted acyl esterase